MSVATSQRLANVACALAAQATRRGWADRPAFHVGKDVWSHAEVYALAERAASGLHRCGVERGQRVVLLLDDGVELVAILLGAARIGAVAIIANPSLNADEHRYLVADADATLVVSRTCSFASPAPTIEAARLLTACETSTPVVDVGWDAPLYIQYTSGTTGRPKGAIHRHRDLLVYRDHIGSPVLGLTPEDVLLSVSKMYFAYGLGNAAVFPLACGCSSVLFPHRPSSSEVIDAIGRYGVSLLFSVPTFYARLCAQAPPGESFRSLRAAVSAGEALMADLQERASRLLGAPLLDQIGSTEAGHAFCSNTIDRNVLGTLGFPVPGFEIEVRSPDGEVLDAGFPGQMWVRGPSVMAGYHKQPEATAAVLVDDWLSTRDSVTCKPDGTFDYHGRLDDVEVVSGMNIVPQEVESVLALLPSIREVAVASVRDDTGATTLRAFVVPSSQSVDRRQLERAVVDLARSRLAPHKVPRSVAIFDQLPRTPSGKLRRYLLREEQR